MKDKLRELIGSMRASGEGTTQSQSRIIEYWADRFSAVLDAEGDGGAVTCQDALIYAGDQYTDKYKDDDRQDIKTDVLNAFYQGANWMRKTNPARSGVVSDEDAGEVLRRFEGTVNDGGVDYLCRRGRMRAALESCVRNRK